MKRLATTTILAWIALSAAPFVAQMAYADPAQCSALKPTIGLDDNGLLSGEGVGSCSASSLRYFRGEIKWDKNFSPDPLTASKTTSGYTDYYVLLKSCDNQNTRSYYMRTFWTSGSDYHDSDHRVIRAC